MKEYGYDLEATHAAAIFEKGTEAANGQTHIGTTSGLIVGSSEWIWLGEDNARRICAALKYFSETTTEEIERLADERFKRHNARHNRPSEAKVRVDGVVSREGNENAHT